MTTNTTEDRLRAALARLDAVEPGLRAFAHVDPGGAAAAARRLDAERAAGVAPGLLDGRTLGVKDIIDVEGLPTGMGSDVYAGHVARADAAAVAACRAAGAVVLGKTVTTEFATYRPGPTRHPHDPSRTPGGSSSGSAAAVAAGLVDVALGTQTAGSIIRPAAFCGVVGFKPTYGRVPRAGVKVQSDTLDTVGGFARDVATVARLAAVLTDDATLALAVGASAAGGVDPTRAGWRIGLFRGPHWSLLDDDVRALATQVAERAGLNDAAAPSGFGDLDDIQARIQSHEASRSLRWERVRHGAGLSAELRALLDAGASVDGAEHAALLAAADAARRRAGELFTAHDLLLAPSAAGEAGAFDAGTGDPRWCRAWTLLGLPCLHLPLGRGRSGLPIGLQLVGRAGDDAAVLHAGAWLQTCIGAASGETPPG